MRIRIVKFKDLTPNPSMSAFIKKYPHMMFFLLVASFLFSDSVFAFQNEPENFREIKWGTNIKELSEMGFFQEDGKFKIYKRKNDKMNIGDADIKMLSYGFYKDRFFSVTIQFDSFSNFSKLKNILFNSGDIILNLFI
jgi:hypothetical protein